MTKHLEQQKIGILDFGGQYAHLLESRIRRLGILSDIVSPADLYASDATKDKYSGLIFSGGPDSVYDKEAPECDEDLYKMGIPLMAICYGHQLLMKQAGGKVSPAKHHEYGPVDLRIQKNSGLFDQQELSKKYRVWMSHSDEVITPPPGFEVLGRTDNCRFAAVGDLNRNLFGLQFHPEVEQTENGTQILEKFVHLCGLEGSWSLAGFLEQSEQEIKKQVENRKVFFFLSGGVDSTVAFALLARALPPKDLIGIHVDTGFMRQGEAQQVKQALAKQDIAAEVITASDQFYSALEQVTEPEKKRQIIGELFLKVQEDATRSLDINPEDWCLGQGTIYPDQIESGASANSKCIKTHHNRVAGIKALLAKGRVIEPIHTLYKDEVREVGRLLGLPDHLLDRHPFPGPGLAIRCLCRQEVDSTLEKQRERKALQTAIEKNFSSSGLGFHVLPIRSVGVQGDRRSYSHCVALSPGAKSFHWPSMLETARQIPNRFPEINRVVLYLGEEAQPMFHLSTRGYLNRERIEFLRRADAKVQEFLVEKEIYKDIWQFPVVLLPLSHKNKNSLEKQEEGDTSLADDNALVLRPVCSTDAMTASVYCMPQDLLSELVLRLQQSFGSMRVFYDLSHKPPGTIEWE